MNFLNGLTLTGVLKAALSFVTATVAPKHRPDMHSDWDPLIPHSHSGKPRPAIELIVKFKNVSPNHCFEITQKGNTTCHAKLSL